MPMPPGDFDFKYRRPPELSAGGTLDTREYADELLEEVRPLADEILQMVQYHWSKPRSLGPFTLTFEPDEYDMKWIRSHILYGCRLAAVHGAGWVHDKQNLAAGQ